MGHINDVRLIGITRGVILVVLLGDVESLQRLQCRYYRIVEYARLVELPDVRFSDTLLLIIRIKDRGPVLRPGVVALAIELSRIVCDGKVDLQELSKRDPAGVIADFD